MKIIEWLKSINKSNNLAMTLISSDGNTAKNRDMFINLMNSIKETCENVLNSLPEEESDDITKHVDRRRATAGLNINTPASNTLADVVLNSTKLDHISAEVAEIKQQMAFNNDIKDILAEIKLTQKASFSQQIKLDLIEHVNTSFDNLKKHLDEQVALINVKEDKDNLLESRTFMMDKYLKKTSENIAERLEILKAKLETEEADSVEQIGETFEESISELKEIVKEKTEETEGSLANYLEKVEEVMRKVSRVQDKVEMALRVLNSSYPISKSRTHKACQASTLSDFKMSTTVTGLDILPPRDPPIVHKHPKFSQSVPIELIIKKEVEDSSSMVYFGGFNNSKRNGYGVLVYKNKAVYEGQWKNNLAHGKGTMVYASGTRYEGEWERSTWNGYGKISYADGSWYIGNLKKGAKVGNGFFNYGESGKTYDGMWENDKRNGKGELVWENGDKYRGLFKDDQMHGEGEMIFSDGVVKKGVWVKGVFEED